MRNLALALLLVLITASATHAANSPLFTAQAWIDRQPIVKTCDAPCVENWVTAGNRIPADQQWLRPLADRLGLPLNILAQANIAYTIEWGYSFERLYGRPPSEYDWIAGYTDRNEAFRELFGATPMLYRVNKWDEADFKLNVEYVR